jgi:hypothetical protein
MTEITLTAQERADILRRRNSKGLQKLQGAKLRATDTGKQDRGRIRDNPFLAYVRRQPCEICGTTSQVEAAHVRSSYQEPGWTPTGMQVKPSDFRCLPLCAAHHREGPDAQHRSNERTWWQAHDIYPPYRCAELYDDFTAGKDQPRRNGT